LTQVSERRYTGRDDADVAADVARRAAAEGPEMIVMNGEEFLSAQEACDLLHVKPATLYAYVSRRLLRSYRQGIRRTRLYRREEVERLTRLRGPESEGEAPAVTEDGGEGVEDGRWIPYV
jgi:citrate synthase